MSTNNITIKVLFFASLREQLGKDEHIITTDQALSLNDCWKQASNNADMPDNTLCAINMEYVKANSLANDGDEVAFFPPVTGG